MRRWNGWGDERVTYALPALAGRFLEERVGLGTPPQDADLAAVVAAVPPARLPSHPLISEDAEERVRHARGQSLPDWVALRSGRLGRLPDGVAFPSLDEEVRALVRFADEAGVRLIPYGGGTSVVGGVTPSPDNTTPTLTVDLRRLSTLRAFDEMSQLATFGAGIRGPDVKALLRAHGATLGLYPQSWEYSTLGGWVATRSSGTQSLGYGRLEQRFAGGRLEAPAGPLEMPVFPASAAGPDLRELVLGSEGRMGILTEATLRVSPLPEREAFHAVFFPSWEHGLAGTRALLQAGLPLSMVRLSTPAETETNLRLAGHERAVAALEQYLGLRGLGDEKCMLVLGLTGRETLVKLTRHEALGLLGEHGGLHLGRRLGKQWHASRFRTPYLRNTLWAAGYAVDTLETATTWAHVPAMVPAIEAALRAAIEPTGERLHVFTHLSHLYPHGASVYTTYLFRLAPDPDETLARWRAMKDAASQAILAHHGTITHQHGVGRDHAPYLPAEKGALGIATLRAVFAACDPHGTMNPGVMI
jgi:alkyldihydroxyacetonephosphate synthase